MPSPHLTKSDFTACRDCRTRLYYRKLGYLSAADDDEYLRFLADGGFMVEFVAKAQFPGGVDLAGLRDPAAAWSAMTTPCLMRTRPRLRRKPRRTTAWRTLTM